MTSSDEREYKLLYDASRKFAQKILLPGREENDKFPFSKLNSEIIKKAFELDFFHVWLPENLGGLGGHLKKLILILQNIAETDASMAVMILTNAMAQEIIIQAGDEKTLEDVFSKGKEANDFLISFQAFTGSFESSSTITVTEKDGHFLLNGEAPYTVLGNISGHVLVQAKVQGDKTDSYFLVSSHGDSFHTGDPVFSLGMHSCPVADLRFADTRATIIGERGKAGEYFRRMYGTLILAGASVAAGIMRGAFGDALSYSRNRVQGGRKIGEWSELQLMLADMAIKVNNAETMISHLAEWVSDKRASSEEEMISASLPLFDHALDVASNGIQVLGGYGYMEDYGQEKRFRDAQHLQSFLGSTYLKKIHLMKSFYKFAS